jgi:MFS family permease
VASPNSVGGSLSPPPCGVGVPGRALVAAHLIAVADAITLLAGGYLWAAVAFSALAGISLGAITSLQGLYTKELIDPEQFRTLFGALQGVIGIGGAAGSAIGGFVLDLGGSHRLLVLAMIIGLLVAVVVLATIPNGALHRSVPSAAEGAHPQISGSAVACGPESSIAPSGRHHEGGAVPLAPCLRASGWCDGGIAIIVDERWW